MGYENVESSFYYFAYLVYIAAVKSSTKKTGNRKSFVFWPVIYRITISRSHSGGLHTNTASREMKSLCFKTADNLLFLVMHSQVYGMHIAHVLAMFNAHCSLLATDLNEKYIDDI